LIVNTLLGTAYLITSGLLFRFIHYCMGASPSQYCIIFSKKGLVISLLYMVGVTTVTYAYQNFSLNDSNLISWWRLGLITSIAYITLRLGNLAKQVRNVISDGD